MNNFWTVLTHTFSIRFKSKSFLISTMITLLLIFGIGNIQSIIEFFSKDDEIEKIALIDETELYSSLFIDNIEEVNQDIKVELYEGKEEEAQEAVKNEEYNSLVVLQLDEFELPKATYYEKSISEFGTHHEIEQHLQQLKVSVASEKAGIEEKVLDDIFAPITFETVSLIEESETKTEEEKSQARGIIYAMLFILYMAVIIYGQMIATDVATEKSSRVMEILISSTPPVTHMFAKIIGVALLGLSQMLIFFIAGYMMIQTKKDELVGGFFEVFGIQDTSISIYIYALIFFVLGYLLYATLAAMLGSLVDRVEDVQQIMMPMIFLIIIAFFIAIFGLGVPESNLVKISSYIPFFTPMVMFLRVGMLNIPAWEIILSLSILIITIVLLGIIGARIYKGGVLMYGRTSFLKSFKEAMVLSRRESNK